MSILENFGFATKTAEELKLEIQENDGGGFEPLLKNEFKVTEDKNGGGIVVMRILPAMGSYKVQSPHVKVRKHFFSYKGVVYDTLCTSFFNDDCPCCSFIRETGINRRDNNSPYKKFNYGEWTNGKPTAPRFSAQEEYWVNVYIKSDTVDPTNNNKVFQYKLPKSVYEKYIGYINGNPSIGEPSEEVYDLLTGRDLQIIYNIGSNGYRSYDSSKFTDKCPITNLKGEKLFDNPEEFMKLLENMEDLHVLIDPETRLYDNETAKSKFDEVMTIINEEMAGGEGGSFSSKNIDDGFSQTPKMKKETGTVKKSDVDDLTSGKYDSGSVDELEVMMSDKSDDVFGDIEDLLGEDILS